MSTSKLHLRMPVPIPISGVTEPLQRSLELGRLNPKRWFLFMAENVTLPRWLLITVLGAVLPSIFGLLFVIGGFLIWVGNTISRMDERQLADRAAQSEKVKPIERQGLLNDEHLRELQLDQARFEGWSKGRAGEGYTPRRGQPEAQPQPSQ